MKNFFISSLSFEDNTERQTRICLGKSILVGSIHVVSLLMFISIVFAAPSDMEKLTNLKGENREQILIEGAKRERTLAFYSSMNTSDSKPLADGFMKKYPFIKVVPFIGRGEAVANRVIIEQRSGKSTADVFCGTSINIEKIRRAEFLIPFYTPTQDIYNKKYLDPNKYWVPLYHNILTFVYNTNKIKDVPKNWQDLLDPRWKGKLAIEDTDELWLINFYKAWGEAKAMDFFTRLGKQNLKIVHGHSVQQLLLIAAEFGATPTQYLHQAVRDVKKGAPINFVIMDPMVSSPQGISLLGQAPHPHASLLFIDYVTSKEVQTFFYNQGRNAAYPGVDPLLSDANLIIDDPVISLDRFDHWQKLYRDLLIAPNKGSFR